LTFVILQVLNWAVPAKDLRGHHENRKKMSTEVMNQIRKYIMDLQPRESHYSQSKNPTKVFLESSESVSQLYRDFIKQNPDLSPYAVLNEVQIEQRLSIQRVQPKMFRKVFNQEFNIGIGYPRSDICEYCERNHVQRNAAAGNQMQLQQLTEQHNQHLIEAEGFYDSMKSEVLSQLPATTTCLNFDYQKNMPLPVTNTSGEFYSRQLWLINFAIHDLRTGESTMFLYSESYAQKGANEVLSCLNYYIRNCLPPNTKDLMLWCDNCYGQNKNRYTIAYLNSLHEDFETIQITFPIPGHTRMAVDRDFAQVEKLKRKHDQFPSPSSYTTLIRNARPNQPFKVIYVQHPLTDDLCDDGTPICIVMDYFSTIKPVLKSTPGFGKLRRFMFRGDGTILTNSSTTEAPDQIFTYMKTGNTLEQVKQRIGGVQLAYHDFVGVSHVKAQNVEKLLEFLSIPDSCVFYSTMYRIYGPNPDQDFTSQSQLTNRGVLDDDEEENGGLNGEDDADQDLLDLGDP
jgi:hypothetical protein